MRIYFNKRFENSELIWIPIIFSLAHGNPFFDLYNSENSVGKESLNEKLNHPSIIDNFEYISRNKIIDAQVKKIVTSEMNKVVNEAIAEVDKSEIFINNDNQDNSKNGSISSDQNTSFLPKNTSNWEYLQNRLNTLKEKINLTEKESRALDYLSKNIVGNESKLAKLETERELLRNVNNYTDEDINDPYALPINVYYEDEHKSVKSAIRIYPEVFEPLAEFIFSITDDELAMVFDSNHCERLLIMKKFAPKSYMANIITTLANKYDSIRFWLFRSQDDNHKLWNPDGTFKKEYLPSDNWKIIELKGSGEVPILEEDEKFLPLLYDNYFFQKVNHAHPIDRRFMGIEYDMDRNPSFWGKVIKIMKNLVSEKLDMVRPYEKDKAYYFPLASEVPHDGVGVKLNEKLIEDSRNSFKLNLTLGRILGNVPAFDRFVRVVNHTRALELGMQAKTLSSYMNSRDQDKSKSNETKS